MEAEHPELNPDNEEGYDEDAVAEIAELKEAFEAKGASSSEALTKSLRLYYKGAKPKDEPKEEAKDESKKSEAEEEAARRKAEAVKKGLDTKGKQPSDKKTGLDSDKAGKKSKEADITKLSDEEFAKLDKEEKKRMRGDIV
jgi:hypothetical protein